MVSYTQNEKNVARNLSLKYAISTLTHKRNQSTCVSRDYARDIHDYLLAQDGTMDCKEAKAVEVSYISQWEDFHDTCTGVKSTRDLVVCYLCGSEPRNDFDKLVSLGILPQNIWAFENNSSVYDKALLSFEKGAFPQPKIIKGKIEKFFEQSPKKFDIVYIDACGALASSKQVLKTFAMLCKHNRLNSPGVVITNFSQPDVSKGDELRSYSKLIALYQFFKINPNEYIEITDDGIKNSKLDELEKSIEENFSYYYGEFISTLIRDISSVIVPTQKLTETNYFEELKNGINQNEVDVNDIQNNSICKYIMTLKLLNQRNLVDSRTKMLLKEFIVYNGSEETFFKSFETLYKIKSKKFNSNLVAKELHDFIDKQKPYKFLDNPTVNLFIDIFINQNTYPLHYVTNACRRFDYTAKSNKMFTDIHVFDECRYLYEWLPTLKQLTSAFTNKSWQYTFRFSVDGLVKSRINYNNEFFFQGSVVSKNVEKFKNQTLEERKNIYELEDS